MLQDGKKHLRQVEETPEQKVFSFTGVFATACRLLASLGGLWILYNELPGKWVMTVAPLLSIAALAVLWNERNIHRRGNQ
jgi:hypothetical protein